VHPLAIIFEGIENTRKRGDELFQFSQKIVKTAIPPPILS
jgi:hypothetical protein